MTRFTRRTFIKHASVAGLTLPTLMPALTRADSAASRIRHVGIGADGMAWSDLRNLTSAPNVELVAVCDVDKRRLKKAGEQYADARQYQRWQELLDREGNKIDTVNISTPDHMHASIAATVLQMGKHVYCQKPLTRCLSETRHLMKMAADRPSVVTQMGIQNHARSEFRIAAQIMRDGVLGKIKRVHSWSNKRWGGGSGRPDDVDSAPAKLDWDAWLGVAPERPFTQGAYHPGSWRNWRDFGCGLLGDMACHVFDPVVTGLGLGAPMRVRSEGPQPDIERWPAAATVHYTFPGTEHTSGDTLHLTWYDGETLPPAEVNQ